MLKKKIELVFLQHVRKIKLIFIKVYLISLFFYSEMFFSMRENIIADKHFIYWSSLVK